MFSWIFVLSSFFLYLLAYHNFVLTYFHGTILSVFFLTAFFSKLLISKFLKLLHNMHFSIQQRTPPDLSLHISSHSSIHHFLHVAQIKKFPHHKSAWAYQTINCNILCKVQVSSEPRANKNHNHV